MVIGRRQGAGWATGHVPGGPLAGAQLGILRGRGPNQKKGHTQDHFKAVMSCGMSVFFLNQKARAEIKGYFSNVCICKTYLSMR